MDRTRAWLLTGIFLTVALGCLLGLYVGTDCGYNTDRPHCGPGEEIAATFLGFGGYASLLVGAVFLVRSVWLEVRAAPPAA